MRWNQQVQGISPGGKEDGVVTPRTKKKRKKENSGNLKDTVRRQIVEICARSPPWR